MADETELVLLDGGLATELERRGHDLSDALWSARLLLDQPDEIVATHLSYFRAGAQVATTASYQASFRGFAARGVGRDDAAALMRRSVELAREAAEVAEAEDGVRRYVAASVGPYGAVLADGSEYTGDYGITDVALRDFHRERTEVLATAGADLLAMETVPSEQEAAVLLEVLDEMPEGTRGWLSLTCADGGTTRRGEDVDRVFALGPRPLAGGRRRRQLHGSRARRGAGAPGGGRERQAGDRVSQQRRELGRARPGSGAATVRVWMARRRSAGSRPARGTSAAAAEWAPATSPVSPRPWTRADLVSSGEARHPDAPRTRRSGGAPAWSGRRRSG